MLIAKQIQDPDSLCPRGYQCSQDCQCLQPGCQCDPRSQVNQWHRLPSLDRSCLSILFLKLQSKFEEKVCCGTYVELIVAFNRRPTVNALVDTSAMMTVSAFSLAASVTLRLRYLKINPQGIFLSISISSGPRLTLSTWLWVQFQLPVPATRVRMWRECLGSWRPVSTGGEVQKLPVHQPSLRLRPDCWRSQCLLREGREV